jgi:transient receptor potential cation channel subfamily M protein 2
MGYLSIFWNKLDVLSLILFFIAIILRFIPSSDCFCGARILLAIDLSIWFIRTLDIFSAVKQLGPKLVMIGEMVTRKTNFYYL